MLQVPAGVIDIPFFPQSSREKLVQIVFHVRLPMNLDTETIIAAEAARPSNSEEDHVKGQPPVSLCPKFPVGKSPVGHLVGRKLDGGDSAVDTRKLIEGFCRHLYSIPYPIR